MSISALPDTQPHSRTDHGPRHTANRPVPACEPQSPVSSAVLRLRPRSTNGILMPNTQSIQGNDGTRPIIWTLQGPVLRPTKTGRTYRVNLDADCLAVLSGHYEKTKERAQRFGSDIHRSSFVFSDDPAGRTPWRPNWITKQFITYRRQAKVNCRLHDLRHFMATTMLSAGIPITTVSARLSHARASTTLNVYAHAVPGGDGFAAEVLSGILSDARSAPTASSRSSLHEGRPTGTESGKGDAINSADNAHLTLTFCE